MTSSLEYLLQRYADKACTPEEREELMRLLRQADNDEQVKQWLDLAIAGRNPRYTMPDDAAAAVLQAIFQSAETPVVPLQRKPQIRMLLVRRTAVAAIVLILLGAGTFLWFNRTKDTGPAKTAGVGQAVKSDIPPGGNKALLTLANGATIVLDSADNGILAQQGNATVVKKNNGQLAYNTQHEKPTEVFYNTLATPRGGQYQLVLPDGSKVWLNAASSVRYPTAFTGKERKIEITGEAYFEISKNADMPFVVKMVSGTGDRGEVKVLGTHFNVNAYDDEETVRTTLLEGSVSVGRDAATAILKPGQQAQLARSGKIGVVDKPDIEEALAWKDGKHYFIDADIETIMRQAARWYDFDVVYKAKIIDHYTVNVPRNVPASQLLRFLELSGGVHFSIEGKKVIVTN